MSFTDSGRRCTTTLLHHSNTAKGKRSQASNVSNHRFEGGGGGGIGVRVTDEAEEAAGFNVTFELRGAAAFNVTGEDVGADAFELVPSVVMRALLSTRYRDVSGLTSSEKSSSFGNRNSLPMTPFSPPSAILPSAHGKMPALKAFSKRVTCSGVSAAAIAIL